MSMNPHSSRRTKMCDGLRKDNMDGSIYIYIYYDLNVAERLTD